jgi:hypothetical protein
LKASYLFEGYIPEIEFVRHVYMGFDSDRIKAPLMPQEGRVLMHGKMLIRTGLHRKEAGIPPLRYQLRYNSKRLAIAIVKLYSFELGKDREKVSLRTVNDGRGQPADHGW